MAIAGVSAGAIVAVLLLTVCPYLVYYRKKKEEEEKLLSKLAVYSAQSRKDSNGSSAAVDTSIKGITVDKSMEWFWAVYYAELRGEKAAIRMMESQKSREFLAELKVLTRVYHLNLVRLIGYCVKKNSLFLVYEYIDNGNLSQHLRDSGREPLPWSMPVQIALDSARDRNFHAKVADFGLTKLTEVGGSAHPTNNLAGTFGYMAPEYAYGSVSSKIDIFAFGVVLYELIYAEEALFTAGESGSDTKGLVSLFEEALEKPNPKEHLQKLVDPRLGDQYTIDSVYKIAQLANVCTDGDPDRRPSMRSVVVTLMTLSSTSMEWNIASLHENPTFSDIISAR
ncbi:hypothetical protein K1719_026389 [Acacia pycnantha]|nr:hypothetical protein K1719_026389 [Acacia pycnantha]